MSAFNISVNDKAHLTINKSDLDQLDLIKLSDREYHCVRDAQSYHAVIKKIDLHKKILILALNDKTYTCKISDPLDLTLQNLNLNNRSKKLNKNLISTMPGMILSVLVKEGQEIAKGDPLMILEAMKMENILTASMEGRVENICCKEKEAVDKGQILITIV